MESYTCSPGAYLNNSEYLDGMSWFFPEEEDEYTQIECNVKSENIGKLIGKDGRIFNAITRRAGVKVIYHLKKLGVIEILGPEKGLMFAKQYLIERMEKIDRQ
jgi:polyribonucleotide nucleotidyltransferase